jgi:type IV secretion system protein VirB5
MRRISLALLIMLSSAAATPARAQGIPVYDSSGYLQALATVKNTLSMIEQGKEQIAEAQQLYGSFNQVTNVNGIASSLSTDAMRHLLPADARDIGRLMSSDNASLGSLGSAATRIREANSVALPELRPGATAYERSSRDALLRNGNMAARDAAIAESAYGVSAQRTAGLEELRTSLDSASDAKQVMDIQARVGVENAHIQNDAVQLQALRMRQEAARQLQMRRDDEQDLADLSASLGGS